MLDIVHLLQQTTPFALLSLVIGMIPLAVALAYAIRPSERWLTLMRPLSLAAIFAALSSLASGWIAILLGVAATGDFAIRTLGPVSAGVAESLTPTLLVFTCLTIAWLLVAVGEFRALRRTA